jgi:F0F1-type ATP synthase gamma subunit
VVERLTPANATHASNTAQRITQHFSSNMPAGHASSSQLARWLNVSRLQTQHMHASVYQGIALSLSWQHACTSCIVQPAGKVVERLTPANAAHACKHGSAHNTAAELATRMQAMQHPVDRRLLQVRVKCLWQCTAP